MAKNNSLSYEIFAKGLLMNGKTWGRPADVTIGPDGSLYVSNDKASCSYRIYYERQN